MAEIKLDPLKPTEMYFAQEKDRVDIWWYYPTDSTVIYRIELPEDSPIVFGYSDSNISAAHAEENRYQDWSEFIPMKFKPGKTIKDLYSKPFVAKIYTAYKDPKTHQKTKGVFTTTLLPANKGAFAFQGISYHFFDLSPAPELVNFSKIISKDGKWQARFEKDGHDITGEIFSETAIYKGKSGYIERKTKSGNELSTVATNSTKLVELSLLSDMSTPDFPPGVMLVRKGYPNPVAGRYRKADYIIGATRGFEYKPVKPQITEPSPNPYGIRYLPPSDRARISIKDNHANNRYLIAYFHINDRGEILLNIHGEWKQYSDDYLIARHQGGEYYHLDKVDKLYSSAYETYRVKVPGNISRNDAISLLNGDQLELFIAVDTRDQINVYKLYPAVAQTASSTTLMNLAKTGATVPYIRYDAISRNKVDALIYRSIHPDVALNSSELSSLVIYTPSGIKVIPPSSITGNKVTMDVSDLHYDTTTGLHRLLYAVVWKDSHKIGGVDCFAGMSETGLDFSQFPVTPFPGVRYVQIGQDRTTVGFGNNWYDRPLVRSEQPLGTLKYTAEDNSTSTCTQTMDSPSPGTYYYANNKTSHGIYPKESADGSVIFTLAWDSGNGLQNHDVKLYKDPYIPSLYSIRPTYNYTNVCHHGHIATDDGSHWFALPGKFVETASLGTNVDYTERRKVLMNSVNNLTVSDNYIGDFWEEGRFVALAADIPYNSQSKQAPSKRINVRSQNSNKPYNYYYGNSFLKMNEAFDNRPRSLNASINYADEDKLPDINQDFTTNCGYNNSNRDLSDWTISRVYYDHMKRLRFGSEDSDYSRVNYRGGVRNLTPDGITPLVGGIATLVNGGTIRVQSGTKSLFTNTPQCAVIEGDIIVDATGNSNEFPLELYKKDTLVAGVLIMRGRILIKGSENINPFIGIRNPTLVINETQWDLNQLFAVIPKPRIPRNYRVIGGILRNGDGVIFVEDTKNLGIPASISSLRNMTVVNMGKTILSDKSVFMIAGNIHTAQIQDMGYFETASFGTCKLIDEISRHITQETIPFGYNGYESISFPYYLTPRIGNGDDGRYGYPEVNAPQDIYNHALYTYDFTGKYYYTEERRGRYRKQYSWYYHTGTAEGFYDFVKNKMKTDDNRELINAKRILVSYEGASSNVVYKMTGSIDEALRSVVWSENSRRSVSFYIFD